MKIDKPALLIPGTLLALLLAACTPAATPEALSSEVVEQPTQADSIQSPSPPTDRAPAEDTIASYDPDGLAPGVGRGFEVLDDPVMISAETATWLDAEEIVLGIEWAGQARAYPISQMAYHHIVNDAVDGNPLLVTY